MKKLYASLLSLSSFFLCSALTSKAEILSMEVLDSLSHRQKATSIRELREAQAAANAAAATISGLDNLPIYMDVDPGEISYQSGVSPSGAKTYSVPIFTAPSVGAKPTIALSYNSQSIAGGIAGVGWNLAGASSINLVSKTLFFDNDVCAIDFSSPNKYAYALDGDRLLTNPSDPIATEYPYMTRNGRVRVKPIFNGNALLYFIALLPDGAKATFGFMDNTKTRASYPITSYTDSRGYRIDFSYELSRNIYYLAQIAYGGKTAGNLSNNIVFEYTQRLDSLTHYISGEAYTMDKLLKKIHSFGHGKLLRTYTLAHEYSRGKTQLHRISCLVGQHQLPPLSFVYGFDTPQNSESIVESGGMFPVTTYIGTETVRIKGRFLKGSPLEGFISFPPKPPYQAYNDNGTIWGSGMSATQEFGFIAHSEASFAPLSITAGEGFQNITAADVDGDGTDEVVKINMNTIYPFAESVVIDVSIYKYDEKTHSLQSSKCNFLISNGGDIRAQPTNFNFISYQWGDVTGDGAIDLICVSSSKTVTGEEKGSYWNLIDIKNNKKLFAKRWNDINYFSNQGGGYSTLDFDGDGKFEIEYWDKNFTRSLYLWDNEIKDFVLIKSGKFSLPFMGVNVNGDAYCDRIEGPMLSYQYDPDQVPDIRDLTTQTSDETVYKERDLVFHDGGNIWTILLYNGTDFEKKRLSLLG
ncbi:hypothetical protein HR09_00575 [Porphyromonas gulae]|uniref:FG-GAP repeat domain-containing protein n=1 Tax=Porphyromonas gulae TaxID=111105 RepID=UPI00052DC801|nr:VCBS repeat-containing protein [Porphyromonas gulae]KGN70846.1 hypothetical protein HR09_00575 [Porphyromonas gulae]